MEIAAHQPVAPAEIMLELPEKLQDRQSGPLVPGCATHHVLALAVPFPV
ncbi:hypothetical protein [uncultured Reyranella sp.]|nr:hypothetical protein [uncultured Reyranella sp.]